MASVLGSLSEQGPQGFSFYLFRTEDILSAGLWRDLDDDNFPGTVDCRVTEAGSAWPQTFLFPLSLTQRDQRGLGYCEKSIVSLGLWALR